MFDRFHERVANSVKWLQGFANRLWYPPLIGILAAWDNLLVVIPTDGILISSCMLTPKRWFWLGFIIALGSSLGGLALAFIVKTQGLPFVLTVYPGIDQSTAWSWTVEFFNQYGLLLVFGVAATPLMQQPAIILASLSDASLTSIFAVMFVGRTLKYLIMAYVGSHAPRLLVKMWGVRGELKDAGVELPQSAGK